MGVFSNSSVTSHNLYYVKLLKECTIKAVHAVPRKSLAFYEIIVRRQHYEYSRDSILGTLGFQAEKDQLAVVNI